MCRYAVAFLLLIAAVPKFADRRSFRGAVAAYRLGPNMTAVAAAAIPWIEISSAVLLLVGVAPAAVALVDCVLFGAFAVANVAAMVSGRRPPCGCFGVAATAVIGWRLVALDLVAACASAVALVTAGANGMDLFVPPPDRSSWAFAIVGAMVVFGGRLVESWLDARSALEPTRTAARATPVTT